MSTVVMKFGGTSVGGADAIAQTADNILAERKNWERICVVVSAMSGVTDQLTEGAYFAEGGDTARYQTILSQLRSSHYRVVDQLIPPARKQNFYQVIDQHLESFERFCASIAVLGEITPRAMDVVTSLGERILVEILTGYLQSLEAEAVSVEATKLIITDDKHQNAVPIMDQSRVKIRKHLLPVLEKGTIPIVTGFIGATASGVTTTLGRGGSDYSAAILGECLEADQVWIWTDVDGVMTSDPRIVSNAEVLPKLSFQELSELAYFGAKVVHPRTIRPVVENNIPLLVRNTFHPDEPGTRIVPEAEQIPSTVKAVTAIRGLSMVNVEGRGMMGVPGIAARTFSAVASCGASVLMITQASSEQSISFVINTENSRRVIASIEEEMALELSRKDIDKVWSQDQVVIVTAVGKGLRNTPGVGARVFTALADADVNVIAVAQGSSESSLSLVVAESDFRMAVQSIHDDVILNP